MFDAHVHLDFPEFDDDRLAVIERARAVGVTGFVVPGVEPKQWSRAAALGLPMCVGVHPQSDAACSVQQLMDAARRHSAVGIGEFGLDRRGPTSHERQVEMCEMHLQVATQLGLPIVLHVVQRHGAALDLLGRERLGVGVGKARFGMVHAFSGSAEVALRYVDAGLHISIGGGVTRPNAHKLHEAVRATPLERLLLETDAPDQGPRTQSVTRNEPAWLVEVASTVARLRGRDVDEISQETEKNARRLFGV